MKYYGNRDITPLEILNTMAEKEIRKEYSRLRKVAVGRLKTLEKSEWGRHSDTWRDYVGEFPAGRGRSKAEVAHRLSKAYYFLGLKTSTVTGLREIRDKFLETMHEDSSYSWLNKDNYWDFTEFMDEVQAYYDTVSYDSDRAVDVFDVMTSNNFTGEDLKNDFDWWMNNYRKVKAKPRIQGMSYDTYKKYVDGKMKKEEVDKYISGEKRD